MTDRPALRIHGAERALVAALLLAFALLAGFSMRQKSPTFDETAHLAAGVSYVQLRDFRMNPEHPALPKLLAGAAATLAGARAPSDSPAWRDGEQWDYAREVLYEGDADWRRILFAGRLPMVALGVLLGFVLWRWTRAMAGAGAAATALVLFSFSPTFLAHTRLVTTDVPLALAVVGTAACLWQSWRTGRAAWTASAAACAALSMLTKFSAFSYAPAWALLLLLPSPARPFRRGALHLAGFAAAALLLTELLVFVCYGFATEWTTIRALGMEGRGVSPGEMAVLRRIPFEIMASIPWPSADFAAGMKTIILYTEAGHPVYLMGMRGDAGWWWSPFVALGVKPSLPLLLLAAGGALAVARRPRARWSADLLFVLVPAALVLGTNVAAKLGLGVRHLLPLFPALLVMAAWPVRNGLSPAAAAALAAGLVWHAAGTLRAHPHYLPFFNEVARAGGGGERFLGDSNLDWGQDLSAAAERLRDLGAGGAVLCYFGTASPFAEPGLEWQVLPPASRPRDRDPWTVLPGEGPLWLAMSETNRQGVYYRADDGAAPYPWLDGVRPAATVGGTIRLYEVSHRPDVLQGMAEVCRRHGLVREETMLLERTVTERATAGEARKRLTDILLSRGLKEEAVRLIMEAPNPDIAQILQASKLQEELGDLGRAEELLRRGIRGYEGDPEIKNQLAWFLTQNGGDLEEALRLADAAVKWDGYDPYFRDTRAVILTRLGRSREAVAEADSALALPGGDLPEIRWHRALALDAAGQRRAAEDAANEVLAGPDVPDEVLREIAEWLARR